MAEPRAMKRMCRRESLRFSVLLVSTGAFVVVWCMVLPGSRLWRGPAVWAGRIYCRTWCAVQHTCGGDNRRPGWHAEGIIVAFPVSTNMPSTAGSVHDAVAAAVKVMRDSRLTTSTSSMFTEIEG